MSQKAVLILTGAAVFVVVTLILGTIFYLTGVFKTNPFYVKKNTNQETTAAPASADINLKIYSASGINIRYPQNWGILTCGNSSNFELDPTNSQDQFGVTCDMAVKPVTVLVNNSDSCLGETVKLGNTSVLRSKVATPEGTSFRWCTSTVPSLDITHRVSSLGLPATTSGDFSIQVENIISRI